MRHLSTVFVPSDKDLETPLTSTMSNGDAIYAEFRDELDDFVTVKD